MSLELRTAVFHSLPQQLFAENYSLEGLSQAVLKKVEDQTLDVIEDLEIVDQERIARHFVCSTMIEMPFTSGAIDWQSLTKEFASSHSALPRSFVNAYECASWGYSLRYYLNQSDNPLMLVTIVDANLLGLEFWQHNENWGDSGFGVCTLLLEAVGDSKDDVITGCATTYNSTAEFATIVRRWSAKEPDCPLSLPFFPEHIRTVFDRMLANSKRLPDKHDDYGHCFGSDPWLAIIDEGMKQPAERNHSVLACSIALNGYYCLAKINISPNTRFHFSRHEGNLI
ncbi:hypothetical protein [Pleionea sediminis]|uniref:hypothetical protein n=1 Tax=Pleionea sediminis TaxID=2569479 RepID=UPI0011864CC0|nr:hypothetical protein [Pleionea sediminis]